LSLALVVDFDGTITEEDLLQDLSARFGDPAVVRELDRALVEGRITLRQEITREFRPVKAPLSDVIPYVLEHSRVRAGFRELVEEVRHDGGRVLVLSSGFEELIRPVLEREGVEVDDVLANRLDPRPDGWRVLWRDEAICAECGQACKRAAVPAEGDVVYIGDGYSDRCAAQAADRVFATKGLARYLDSVGAPYEPFEDFFDIAAALRRPEHGAAQAS
jgi:2-hydroxy-3-keto-5-methylthiopentenyl-1-phosphate phosphatase